MDKRSRCIVKSSLPDDIIFYLILPRVPAEVLHSWRFVCKQWFHMLSNGPGFLDAQLVLSRPRFIFDVRYSEFCREATYRKKFDVEITFNNITRTITSFTWKDLVLKSRWISDKDDFIVPVDSSTWFYFYWNRSCNGLILSYSYNYDKGSIYYMFNPVTRQYVVLPQCENVIGSWVGFGYDLVAKKYKVVRIYWQHIQLSNHTGISSCCECAVLTLGSNKWKLIRYPFEHVDNLEPSLYVDGFLHFKCRARPQFPSYNTFVSMDIANETFWLTRSPDSVRGEFTIFKLGDCLALSPHDGNLDIWILEDCSKGIWTKKYSSTMNLHYGCRRRGLVGSLPDALRPIGAFNSGEGEVVIYKDEKGFRLFYYVTWSNELNEVTSTWRTINRHDIHSATIIKAFNHVGTLVSPHDLLNKNA